MPLLGRDKDITTGFIRPERPLIKSLFDSQKSFYKDKIKALEAENRLLEERIKYLERELEALRLQLTRTRIQMPLLAKTVGRQAMVSSTGESRDEIKRKLMELGLTEEEADGFLRYGSA